MAGDGSYGLLFGLRNLTEILMNESLTHVNHERPVFASQVNSLDEGEFRRRPEPIYDPFARDDSYATQHTVQMEKVGVAVPSPSHLLCVRLTPFPFRVRIFLDPSSLKPKVRSLECSTRDFEWTMAQMPRL